MKHSAIFIPQSIQCGQCGHQMRYDDTLRLGQPVIVRCYSTQCEDYDIPLIFPVTRIELQRVEACQ